MLFAYFVNHGIPDNSIFLLDKLDTANYTVVQLEYANQDEC